MDYTFPSIHNQNLLQENLTLIQEKDPPPPLFFNFPSPFLDHMDHHTTNSILPNLHNNRHVAAVAATDEPKTTSLNNNPLKVINTTKHKPSGSKLIKRVRKKRSVGKNDRHSKIHTAQGLRDRRMRLSVNTARKFFDLNDMLGFDKASKTIEWLFSKSQKAINEVSRESNKIESHVSEDKNDDQIKNLEKSKDLVQEDDDPSVDFQLSQLGLLETTDQIKNLEKSPSSCGYYDPLEVSNTYHFLKHLHLDSSMRSSENYFDYNKTVVEPPVGWLNSRNTFLGFLEGWDSQNSRMESHKGFVQNIAPGAGIVSSSFVKFDSENQGE